MSYLALYRKFRPETFDEVRGQDHIVTTLKNQMKKDRLGHAYLFCGTRGTGKTSVARILARAVNCDSPRDGNPCNECPTCRSILSGNSMSVVEIDAASNNGVDNIRELRDEVTYRPAEGEGKKKVYIIDEVHMLSTGAFNALLKTLEEPPDYVMFILATTEAHKIPVTILSRCQRYDFHRITVDVITGRMKELLAEEGVEAEDRALSYVARMGDGSMRDSLSLLDQCIAFYMDEKVTYEHVLDVLGAVDTEVFTGLLDDIMAGDVTGSLLILQDMVLSGRELNQFVNDFTWYLRNILIMVTSENPEEAVDASKENLSLMKEQAGRVDADTLMRYIRVLSSLSGSLRNSTQKRVLIEVALIRLCRPQMETGLDSVLDRLRVLELKAESTDERLENMRFVPASGAAPAQKGAGERPSEGEAFSGEAQKREEVTAPAPGLFLKAAEKWKVIAGMTSSLVRNQMKDAKPRYDPKNPVKLLIPLASPSALGTLEKSEQGQAELMEAIEKVTGASIPFEFILEGGPGTKGYRELPAWSPADGVDATRNTINKEMEEEDF